MNININGVVFVYVEGLSGLEYENGEEVGVRDECDNKCES